jgi:sugar phosphate isomerase/epimerase
MRLAYMYATPDVTHSNVTAIQGEMAATMALIRATGYSGVELLVRDPRRIDRRALQAAVDAEGLDVPAVCTGEVYGEDGLSFADPDPARRAEARVRMTSALDLAARFDAMVNVGRLRGRYVAGVDPRQTMDWIAQALTECARAYPQTAIVIEPVNHLYANCLLNTAETMEFVRRLDLPSVGIMLDSVHMMIEGEDVGASMRAAASHLRHFHISDSDRLPVGDGSYPIADFFAALRAVGFDRYVTVETFQIPDARYSIGASFDALKSYFPDRPARSP